MPITISPNVSRLVTSTLQKFSHWNVMPHIIDELVPVKWRWCLSQELYRLESYVAWLEADYYVVGKCADVEVPFVVATIVNFS